jgi:hypothetical protein
MQAIAERSAVCPIRGLEWAAVPQLPRVAVIGGDLAGAVALAELVDGGLTAAAFAAVTDPADPADPAATYLAARGLGDRLIRAETGGLDIRPCDGARRPFQIWVDGAPRGGWDAVVLTPAAPDVSLPDGSVAAAGDRYGGVFHPDVEGVYRVGAGRPAGVGPRPGPAIAAVPAVPAVVAAQARWIGEYLRGRYLLPARSAMVAHPALRRYGPRLWAGRRYLARLEGELRRGRARAAQAGYPLPVPAAGS